MNCLIVFVGLIRSIALSTQYDHDAKICDGVNFSYSFFGLLGIKIGISKKMRVLSLICVHWRYSEGIHPLSAKYNECSQCLLLKHVKLVLPSIFTEVTIALEAGITSFSHHLNHQGKNSLYFIKYIKLRVMKTSCITLKTVNRRYFSEYHRVKR